jgi:hypothetical protein
MLESMRTELEKAVEEREEIDQRIAQLKQGILSIAPLAKEIATDELTIAIQSAGMTEAVRDILRAVYPKRLSPVEIKDQLKARGQDLTQHSNVMASVHSTLKRMLDNEEIRTNDEGLTYGWRRFAFRHRRRNQRAAGVPLSGLMGPKKE